MHTGGQGQELDVWQKVTFKPWIGRNYRSAAHWGSRLLILGWSHYKQFTFPEPLYTRHVIRAHLNGEAGAGHQFWTDVARVLTGKPSFTPGERREFWRSVAFYNYIQEFVGAGPEAAPTKLAWARSHAPFREVLRQLEPDIILVLGRVLWRKMLPQDLPGPSVGHAPDDAVPTEGRLYRTGTRKLAFAVGIKHPSRGFNYRTWAPYVQQFLRRGSAQSQSRDA